MNIGSETISGATLIKPKGTLVLTKEVHIITNVTTQKSTITKYKIEYLDPN